MVCFIQLLNDESSRSELTRNLQHTQFRYEAGQLCVQSHFMYSRGMSTIAPPRPSKLYDTESFGETSLTAWGGASPAVGFEAQVTNFADDYPDRLPHCFEGVWGEIRVDSVVVRCRALASAPTISRISLGPVALHRRMIR